MNTNLSWFLQTYCQKKLFVSFMAFQPNRLEHCSRASVSAERCSLWTWCRAAVGVEFLITSELSAEQNSRASLMITFNKVWKSMVEIKIREKSSVLSWERHNSPKECVTFTAHGLSNLSVTAQSSILRVFKHLSLPVVPVS